MTTAVTKATPKARAGVTALPTLNADQLDGVRALAREGVREMTARRALGLTPAQWKALRADLPDGELSPLSLALAEGLAEGQADVIAFMKRRMVSENSESAATWLASNVFKLGKPDGEDTAPRVAIVINAAMTPEDYRRMIEVQSA